MLSQAALFGSDASRAAFALVSPLSFVHVNFLLICPPPPPPRHPDSPEARKNVAAEVGELISSEKTCDLAASFPQRVLKLPADA